MRTRPKNSPHYWGAGGALLSLLLLLTSCSRVLQTTAEHKISDLLPRYLGPADLYTTHVTGHADAMLRGRIRTVHIEGQNVRLTPALTVNHLTVELSDVSVDPSAGKVQKIGETTFAARVTEGALNRFALSHNNSLQDASISLGDNGKITVTARPELLGYPTVPVSVRGVVRIEPDGRHLDFFPDNAKIKIGISMSTGIPDVVSNYIASRINPIADLSDAPLPIVVDSVIVEKGALTMTGYVPGEALQEAIQKASQ